MDAPTTTAATTPLAGQMMAKHLPATSGTSTNPISTAFQIVYLMISALTFAGVAIIRSILLRIS